MKTYYWWGGSNICNVSIKQKDASVIIGAQPSSSVAQQEGKLPRKENVGKRVVQIKLTGVLYAPFFFLRRRNGTISIIIFILQWYELLHVLRNKEFGNCLTFDSSP